MLNKVNTDSYLQEEDRGDAATIRLCKYRQTKSYKSHRDTDRDFKALLFYF